MTDPQDLARDPARSLSSELREYARGRLDVDHHDLDPAAGLVEDDQVRDLLIFARQAWDKRGLEGEIDQTAWYSDRLERQASAVATEAVKIGNAPLLDYMSGRPDYQPDVRGLHAIHRLETWLVYSEAAKMIYLAGHMGSGKTDFAHLCAEVVDHRCEVDDDLQAAEIRTNIPTSDYQSMTSYPDFREWLERGSSDENRWFIFDEASSALTGYSHDREAVEKLMSHLVKLARKNGVNMVIIGHTGMDLHADLRRLCDYVEKPSKKTVRVYATVNRGEGQGHLFDLDRLPPSKVDFDTEDEAPWSWGDALDAEDDRLDPEDVKRLVAKRAASLYESTDLTQEETVDLVNSADSDGVTITRNHLRAARKGEYQEVSV